MDILARAVAHRGSRFDVVVHTLRTKAGDTVEKEFVDHPGAVAIVPVLDDGRVVLLRNFRHAINDVLWELPAGTLFPGEEPERAAARELAEETGFRARRLQWAFEFLPAPGVICEKVQIFWAEGLLPGVPQREPGEEMEIVALPLADALAMTWNGGIRDAKTIIGLWHYERQWSLSGGQPMSDATQ